MKRLSVAEYLSNALDMSGKNLRTVADEVGYAKPNILSMMRQGDTKIPIEKVPALAKATGVDPAIFTRLALREYLPNVWDAMVTVFGRPLTEQELAFVTVLRVIDPDGRIEISDDLVQDISELLRARQARSDP